MFTNILILLGRVALDRPNCPNSFIIHCKGHTYTIYFSSSMTSIYILFMPKHCCDKFMFNTSNDDCINAYLWSLSPLHLNRVKIVRKKDGHEKGTCCHLISGATCSPFYPVHKSGGQDLHL